jgi:hypothetical protein
MVFSGPTKARGLLSLLKALNYLGPVYAQAC